MSQVSVAGCAAHLGAGLTQRVVLEQSDGFGVDRFVKRRPTAVTVEFRASGEEFSTTTATRVKTGAVFLEQFARPGALGPRLAKDVESFGGERRAPLRFGALTRVVCHAHH